ncbi:hypothetical protein AGMMS49942_07050 [Spirochaetia bacterium]|nr:hypothetical protein AGMMS49942_07050 [Spirochaetia bacterium]
MNKSHFLRIAAGAGIALLLGCILAGCTDSSGIITLSRTPDGVVDTGALIKTPTPPTAPPTIAVQWHNGDGWDSVIAGIEWRPLPGGGPHTFKVKAVLLNVPAGFDHLQWSFDSSAPQQVDAPLSFKDSDWNGGKPVPGPTEMTITYSSGKVTKTIYVWNCKSDGTRGTLSTSFSVGVNVMS